MKRRRLFMGVGAAVLLGALGLAGAYVYGTEEEVVDAIVRRRLGQLKFQDADLARFCQEYVTHRSEYRKQFRLLATADGLYRLATPYKLLPMGAALRRLEDNIVSNFLLATDFFDKRADVNRPLNYLGLFDPYRQPCRRLFVS